MERVQKAVYVEPLSLRVRLARRHGKSRTFFMSCLICILILLVPRMEQSEVNRRLQCLLMVLIILSKIQCLKIFSLQKIKPSSMRIIIFNMKAASFFIISSENRGYNLESPNFSPPSFFQAAGFLDVFFAVDLLRAAGFFSGFFSAFSASVQDSTTAPKAGIRIFREFSLSSHSSALLLSLIHISEPTRP